jgi:hypothetical protein
MATPAGLEPATCRLEGFYRLIYIKDLGNFVASMSLTPKATFPPPQARIRRRR